MHPAPSVIIFTTLSGLGFGLLVWLGMGFPFVTGWVAFAFFAIAYALAHLPVGFSSVGLLLEPVAAGLLAWIILAEAVSPWQAVGGAVILWGIVLARKGSR